MSGPTCSRITYLLIIFTSADQLALDVGLAGVRNQSRREPGSSPVVEGRRAARIFHPLRGGIQGPTYGTVRRSAPSSIACLSCYPRLVIWCAPSLLVWPPSSPMPTRLRGEWGRDGRG